MVSDCTIKGEFALIIHKLKTNHIVNPLGFDYSDGGVRFSFIAEDTDAKKMTAAQIEVALDEGFNQIVFDSGRDETISSLAYTLPIETAPRTRYFWRVSVWADNGDFAVSEPAWFETAKQNEAWNAKWITPDLPKDMHSVLFKEISLSKPVKRARAYMCGLGLYEMYIGGEKIGNDYLAPHCNAYDKWLQYQTYDITENLTNGSGSLVEVMLGKGWYMGRFGFADIADRCNLFGDTPMLLCEMAVEYADGTEERFCSDTTWQARKSPIVDGNIYDGEIYDATLDCSEIFSVSETEKDFALLKARLSPPVLIKETLKPVEIITTPKGETVIDMGQNMVGWLTFTVDAPKGTKIFLQHGEVLQDDCFYNDNLRSALAEYTYISDGTPAVVRPHFTFYGFRYVKIEGFTKPVTCDDFTGCVVYSDMETTGNIETSDPLVNRLFQNAMWGQKDNFLDTPTDCPQRDERMGWTGDAQVFSGTACFNMDTYAFYSKYLFDLAKEQEADDGRVTFVVPNMLKYENHSEGGSCAWGDAATVIPWNVYLFSGDKAILAQQFDSMKSWVDYIRRADEAAGKRNLWLVGDHFGDWLALDGPVYGGAEGGTDRHFIASAYYCYSTEIVAKAARVLGKTEIAEEYEALAADIREAFAKEFFTETGRIAMPTQTGMIVSLFMDLVPPQFRERLKKELRKKIHFDGGSLKTGFVGTAYLCRTFSDNDMNDIAYNLLLTKDYPGWLYTVLLGATTIWERWNAVLPDGKLSGIGMNSLNHYSYGAVMEWMYRNVSGLQPLESHPGFKKIRLAPQPDSRLSFVNTTYNSASGEYISNWRMENDTLSFEFKIPFDASADLTLPYVSSTEGISVNGKLLNESGFNAEINESGVSMALSSGSYTFTYAINK
jgi:Alpha-L-rhamnosidase N-terminal domain./Bacterial alpha-L-rhamnosidase.